MAENLIILHSLEPFKNLLIHIIKQNNQFQIDIKDLKEKYDQENQINKIMHDEIIQLKQTISAYQQQLNTLDANYQKQLLELNHLQRRVNWLGKFISLLLSYYYIQLSNITLNLNTLNIFCFFFLDPPPEHKNTSLEQKVNKCENKTHGSFSSLQLTDDDMSIIAYYLLRDNSVSSLLCFRLQLLTLPIECDILMRFINPYSSAENKYILL